MADAADVCVLIPTLNEAATIGDVIDGFVAEGFEYVLVIDGGSTDETQAIAEERGAEVMVQSGSGKGQAVREALGVVESDVVLLVDGDGTYLPSDAPDLVHPIHDGGASHVIGDRFADLRSGAMTALNRVGNRIINCVFLKIHGRDFRDILSGYRAFTTKSAQQMQLSAEGFGIETEMAVECVRNDINTAVVDITYQPRPDRSSTNLRPFRDGGVILTTLYRLARTTNPLFYFGSLGAFSTFVGVAIGIYVAYEWFVRGIPHQVLAMVSVFGILFGFQLLTFGVLTDMIVRLRR
jgi:dolichol-phosphate mannosyltransferase